MQFFVRKKSLICFVITALFSFSLHANTIEPCNATGEWWDIHGLWSLTQTNTILNGYDWEQTGTLCSGRYPLSGTVDDNNVSFRTTNPHPSKDCADWFDYQGTFSSECNIINGTWVNSNGKSGVFQLERNPKPSLKIISPAKNHPPFLIDANEKMPTISFIVQITKKLPDPTPQTEFTWSHTIIHQVTPKQIYSATWQQKSLGKDSIPQFDLFLTDGLRGGEFKIKVETDIDGTHLFDERKHKIYGTNPGKNRIDAELAKKAGIIPLYVLQGIVCQESRYRQFTGNREEGTGIPVYGEKVKNRRAIGMMQLYKPAPPDNAIWSWKNNLNLGIENLLKKISDAKRLPINERNRVNKKRKNAGLPLCTKESIPPLSQDQLIREVIRRYNGGREHQWEPWEAPRCEDGRWEVDPTDTDDINYVDNVLVCHLDTHDYWNPTWDQSN